MKSKSPRISVLFLLALLVILVSCEAAPWDPFNPVNTSNISSINVTKILEDNRAVFSIAGMIVGGFSLFAGYALIFPVFAVAGFAVGGVLSFELVLQFAGAWDYRAYAAIGALVLGGLVGGYLMYNVVVLGVFGTGAAFGLAITYALKDVVFTKLPQDYGSWPLIGTAIALACVGGILTLYFERVLLVTATSSAGAFALINGINVFWGKAIQSHFKYDSDYHWMMIGLWVVLSLIGMLVQFKVTAKDKEDRWYVNKNKKDQGERLPLNRQEVRGAPVVGYQTADNQQVTVTYY